MKARPAVACTANTGTNLDPSTIEARVTTLITKSIEAHPGRKIWTRLAFWPALSVACSVGVKLAAALLGVEEAWAIDLLAADSAMIVWNSLSRQGRSNQILSACFVDRQIRGKSWHVYDVHFGPRFSVGRFSDRNTATTC
jgi:hypothetical protein